MGFMEPILQMRKARFRKIQSHSLGPGKIQPKTSPTPKPMFFSVTPFCQHSVILVNKPFPWGRPSHYFASELTVSFTAHGYRKAFGFQGLQVGEGKAIRINDGHVPPAPSTKHLGRHRPTKGSLLKSCGSFNSAIIWAKLPFSFFQGHW